MGLDQNSGLSQRRVETLIKERKLLKENDVKGIVFGEMALNCNVKNGQYRVSRSTGQQITQKKVSVSCPESSCFIFSKF